MGDLTSSTSSPFKIKVFLDLPDRFRKSPKLWQNHDEVFLETCTSSFLCFHLRYFAQVTGRTLIIPSPAGGAVACDFKVEIEAISRDPPQPTFSLSVRTPSLWLREREKETHCLLTPSVPPETTFFFYVFLSSPHTHLSFIIINKLQAPPQYWEHGHFPLDPAPHLCFHSQISRTSLVWQSPLLNLPFAPPRGALAISIELRVSTSGSFLLEFSVHWKFSTTFYSALKSMAPEGRLPWCLQGCLWPLPPAWLLCDVTCQVGLASPPLICFFSDSLYLRDGCHPSPKA